MGGGILNIKTHSNIVCFGNIIQHTSDAQNIFISPDGKRYLDFYKYMYDYNRGDYYSRNSNYTFNIKVGSASYMSFNTCQFDNNNNLYFIGYKAPTSDYTLKIFKYTSGDPLASVEIPLSGTNISVQPGCMILDRTTNMIYHINADSTGYDNSTNSNDIGKIIRIDCNNGTAKVLNNVRVEILRTFKQPLPVFNQAQSCAIGNYLYAFFAVKKPYETNMTSHVASYIIRYDLTTGASLKWVINPNKKAYDVETIVSSAIKIENGKTMLYGSLVKYDDINCTQSYNGKSSCMTVCKWQLNSDGAVNELWSVPMYPALVDGEGGICANLCDLQHNCRNGGRGFHAWFLDDKYCVAYGKGVYDIDDTCICVRKYNSRDVTVPNTSNFPAINIPCYYYPIILIDKNGVLSREFIDFGVMSCRTQDGNFRLLDIRDNKIFVAHAVE